MSWLQPHVQQSSILKKLKIKRVKSFSGTSTDPPTHTHTHTHTRDLHSGLYRWFNAGWCRRPPCNRAAGTADHARRCDQSQLCADGAGRVRAAARERRFGVADLQLRRKPRTFFKVNVLRRSRSTDLCSSSLCGRRTMCGVNSVIEPSSVLVRSFSTPSET